MKLTKILLFLLFISFTTFGQVFYQGPADGSVVSGVIMNTDNFPIDAIPGLPRFQLFNKYTPTDDFFPKHQLKATGPEGSNTIDISNFVTLRAGGRDSVIQFQGFEGIPETNSIPPDPYLAVGPNHIVHVVNSIFRISDKEGNSIKSINADGWFQSAMGVNPDAFDPKVIYDHYAQRWIMVWLSQNDGTSESFFLVSASDDDDPTGEWFNWALPSNTNGNTIAGNWGDYQGVGFDDEALYITSNQFTFGSTPSYQYTKIRIIDKSQLYGAQPGQVAWKDLYNVRYPGSTGTHAFGIRPARMKSTANEYYLMVAPGGSTVGLYKISDPLTSPTLTGAQIPVTVYSNHSGAQQLGGGTPLVQSGGNNFRNEPVYQDGFIYATHAVGFSGKIGVNYLKVDASANSARIDVTMGTPDHYHIWPALAVSGRGDVILTYSRSSADEYIGAFFTIVRNGSNDPLGSFVLQEGGGNYVKTFGGTRNRWGDYMGAWIDPVDTDNFWVSTEYALRTNTWGVWIGGIRTIPYQEPYIFFSTPEIDFGPHEITTTSDIISVTIRNYGEQSLIITNVENFNDDYDIVSSISTPLTLQTYDSLVVELSFSPSVEGAITDSLAITSNDPDEPVKYVSIQGWGYLIPPVAANTLYGTVSISGGGSKLLTIDPATAEGIEIGVSELTSEFSLTIYPETSQMYGLTEESDQYSVMRVNPIGGDSYVHFDLPMVTNALAFDTDNTLYGISLDRELYSIDPNSGDMTFITDVDVSVSATAIDPTTGVLWAAGDSSNADNRIYTIDKTTGAANLVGNTGLNNKNFDLTFDSDGNFYSIIQKVAKRTYLVSIDKSTAAGTEIGYIGWSNITGLVFSPDSVVYVQENNLTHPKQFALGQNYPNPFNPSTSIDFYLPVNAQVRLSIFNVLGEELQVLIDQRMNSGNHSIDWNASDGSNEQLSSGVYIYRIKALGDNGIEYVDNKKMILLK